MSARKFRQSTGSALKSTGELDCMDMMDMDIWTLSNFTGKLVFGLSLIYFTVVFEFLFIRLELMHYLFEPTLYVLTSSFLIIFPRIICINNIAIEFDWHKILRVCLVNSCNVW